MHGCGCGLSTGGGPGLSTGGARTAGVISPGAPAGVVGERDVLEPDFATDALQCQRPRAIGQVRCDVQQLEDLLQGGHPRLVGGVELRQLLDRFEQVGEGSHECHDCACCDVAFQGLVAAVQDDQRERHAGEHFHRREVGGVEPHRDHVRVAVLRVELGEARLVAGLLAKAAYNANPGQGLLQVGGDRADRLPRAPERAGRDEPEPDRAARATNGTTQNVSRASFTSRNSRTTTAPTSVRPAWNSVTTESVTRLSNASTSLVMREISTPAGRLS